MSRTAWVRVPFDPSRPQVQEEVEHAAYEGLHRHLQKEGYDVSLEDVMLGARRMEDRPSLSHPDLLECTMAYEVEDNR